ncbi:MAG: PstA family ABC transporter permease [Gammaproteobacteria bacterium WSBS_2016_MAG_OTU1]
MTKKHLAIRRRYAREQRFIYLSITCIVAVMLFLGGFFANLVGQGWRGFLTSSVLLTVELSPATIGADGQKSALAYQRAIKKALRDRFPVITNRTDKKQVHAIVSYGGGVLLHDMVAANPDLIGQTIDVWLPAGDIAESYFKGAATEKDLADQQITAAHIARLKSFKDNDQTKTSFNSNFFSGGDSRNPELAGIGGALRGSFFTLLLTFLFSFPTALLAALYLEMFAPRNRWFDFIEININNLAAVPSVIFGLLGLAVFINIFGMPRSSPLVGGLVLSLMTLPTIVIAARASLKAVPPSLFFGALSLGATRMQGVFHHVLPAAMPGILTGAIIGMARALGETAPLLMIGMVAFIADAPTSITDAATALPVQVFLWADSPERGFAERTVAAIIVLLGFLAIMNAAAVILRNRLEIKW